MKWFATLLAIIILVMPPTPAVAKSIMVGVCGAARISVPVKTPLPKENGDHGCCKKACHAASERRKKADGNIDDGCC